MTVVELEPLEAEIHALQASIAGHIRDARGHLEAGLECFRRAGMELLQLQAIAPRNQWRTKVDEIGIDYGRACQMMRIATYWDRLPAEAHESWTDEAGRLQQPSLSRAERMLSTVPGTVRSSAHRLLTDPNGIPLRDLARRMRSDGITYREISRMLDVPLSTVQGWLYDPEKAKAAKAKHAAKVRDRREASRLLENHRRAKSTTNNHLEKAWFSLRKVFEAIESADQGVTPNVRQAIEMAHQRAISLEAALQNALKLVENQ